MIIVGENLNSSNQNVRNAFDMRDVGFVAELAKEQVRGGAAYLDINAAMCENEAEALLWAASAATQATGLPIMVDSPNENAICFLYENVKLKHSVINSITLGSKKLEKLLPVAQKYNTGVVAMPVLPGQIPDSVEKRVENARRLVLILNENGIGNDRIFLDIAVMTVAGNAHASGQALAAARQLREEFPDLCLIAGVSNVSYGLPGRRAVNVAFACQCMENGVDSVIIDATDVELTQTLSAMEMLRSGDEYIKEYLDLYRKQKK